MEISFAWSFLEFKIASLVHQSLTSKSPTYLTVDIRLVSEHGRRSLHSSSNKTLAVPRSRSSFGDKALQLQDHACGTVYLLLSAADDQLWAVQTTSEIAFI